MEHKPDNKKKGNFKAERLKRKVSRTEEKKGIIVGIGAELNRRGLPN
jgi:hypothetical protein